MFRTANMDSPRSETPSDAAENNRVFTPAEVVVVRKNGEETRIGVTYDGTGKVWQDQGPLPGSPPPTLRSSDSKEHLYDADDIEKELQARLSEERNSQWEHLQKEFFQSLNMQSERHVCRGNGWLSNIFIWKRLAFFALQRWDLGRRLRNKQSFMASRCSACSMVCPEHCTRSWTACG